MASCARIVATSSHLLVWPVLGLCTHRPLSRCLYGRHHHSRTPRAVHTDLLHYSGLEFGDLVADAVDASDPVRNLLAVIGWLLMLPTAWLTTVYFEKPIGALITRMCA
jgi:hypothetical protein